MGQFHVTLTSVTNFLLFPQFKQQLDFVFLFLFFLTRSQSFSAAEARLRAHHDLTKIHSWTYFPIMVISKLTSAVFLKQKLKLKQPKNCDRIVKSAHFLQDSTTKRTCFIRMRYSVPLLGCFHGNYRHRKRSKSGSWLFELGFQTPAKPSPPLSLSSCERFSVSSPLLLETVSFSTVDVEPKRVWVPAGETAARFLSGPQMEKAAWDHLGDGSVWGLFLSPQLAVVSDVCVGPAQMCLLKPEANPVSPSLC